MAGDDVARGESRRRRRRGKRKRKNRRLDKLVHDLRWLVGALVIGLPVLAVVLFMTSRY